MRDEYDADAAAEREFRRERRFQLRDARVRRQLADAAIRLRARREGWLDLAPPDGASERAIRAQAPRVIGIRAAKAKLGELVRDVRAGRDWLITDRGRPVARLVPVTLGDLSLTERLRQLEVARLLEPARTGRRFPEPIALEPGATSPRPQAAGGRGGG